MVVCIPLKKKEFLNIYIYLIFTDNYSKHLLQWIIKIHSMNKDFQIFLLYYCYTVEIVINVFCL